MAVEPQSSFPQWLISPLVWVLAFFVTLVTGCVGWCWRTIWLRVTTVEDAVKDLGLQQQNLQLEMAPLISRAELSSHLDRMRDESDARFAQLRDDRQRMHQENLNNTQLLREEIAANATAVRDDIGKVHARIDDVFKTIR